MELEFTLNQQLKRMELQAMQNLEGIKANLAAQGEAGNEAAKAAVGQAKAIGSPPSSATPKKAFESKKNDTLEGGNITTQQFEPR